MDGTKCYYNGEQVLTVTDSNKILVGMGAYIVIFPDKKVFNTNDKTVKDIEATYTQGWTGPMTFEELTQDSVFCKISAAGIDQVFERSDGVTFSGVNDDSFLVDGKDATKVITEKGDGYIVVSAVIQNSYTGKVRMRADGANTRLDGTGINEKFKGHDTVRIAGCSDDALNLSAEVTFAGTNNIIIETPFPAKTYTQTASAIFSPYYSGSDKTRIYAEDLGSGWSQGDIVTIAGCTRPAYNKSMTIEGAGTNFIIVDGTLPTGFTQTSGLTITRTAHEETGITVKRTSFYVPSGVTIKRECQDFDYVCEQNNRLWACSNTNHEIYASKLGDPTNWACYEGISTDSYTVTVGSDGDFTGCVSHMGHVLFFKENTIHMMYGDKPSNFSLNTSDMPGVMEGCADSIEIVNETLFYVGRDGVFQFDGAIPTKISRNITSSLREAVSVQAKGRLYISCLMDGERKVLCYDPALKVWDVENEDNFLFAHYGGGTGYFIDEDGKVRTIIGDDTDRIDWMVESPDIREDLFSSYISKLMFTLWLERGTVANFYIRYEDEPLWEHRGTIRAEMDKLYTLPIVPRRCSKYRYKIEFFGSGKLISGGRYVEGGTELYGSVQHGHRRA